MRIKLNVQRNTIRPQAGSRCGFTILEMMLVVSIILIVVGLLSVALNQARTRTMRITCLDNMKQLQYAWTMYADDHNDYVALNKTQPGTGISLASPPKSSTESWVTGNPKLDRSTTTIAKGSLFPYVKNNADVYHCPMDSSTTPSGWLRNRSYSISAYLGGDDEDFDTRVKMRTTELIAPPPDRVFVFIEEHENSIWASGFLVFPRERFNAGTGVWSSTPSDRHMRGGNLTFADGHLEYWKWRSPKKPSMSNQLIDNPGELRDLRRLQAAMPKP